MGEHDASLEGLCRRPVVALLEAHAEKDLVQQVEIQSDDQRGHQDRRDRGHATIDQYAHNVAPPREHDQRDQSKGQSEAQDDLAEDQGPGRIKVRKNYDHGRQHGDQPANPRLNVVVQEALHDDLARHRAHG